VVVRDGRQFSVLSGCTVMRGAGHLPVPSLSHDRNARICRGAEGPSLVRLWQEIPRSAAHCGGISVSGWRDPRTSQTLADGTQVGVIVGIAMLVFALNRLATVLRH
jgi:hypothetical protein